MFMTCIARRAVNSVCVFCIKHVLVTYNSDLSHFSWSTLACVTLMAILRCKYSHSADSDNDSCKNTAGNQLGCSDSDGKTNMTTLYRYIHRASFKEERKEYLHDESWFCTSFKFGKSVPYLIACLCICFIARKPSFFFFLTMSNATVALHR